MVTPSLRLERLIGEGAMGSVWVADHLTLDTKVAIKFIATDHREKNRESLLARFELEAKAAAQIKSPHVVHIYDNGVMDDGTPYIVMERLEGESLGLRLRQGSPLAIDEVTQLVTQVARALSKAHELGIVHRDIKPDNIFLVPSDDELFFKVLDFGIAKSTTDPNEAVTATGALLGTPLYMSPELVQSCREATLHADLWALSVVAYEALTGKPPFVGETVGKLFFSICGDAIEPPSSRRQGLPPDLDGWFARALCQDQDKRFATARELAKAFVQAVESSEAPAAQAATANDGEAATTVAPEMMSTSDYLAHRNLAAAVDEAPGVNPRPVEEPLNGGGEPPLEPNQPDAGPGGTATLEGASTDVSAVRPRRWFARPVTLVGAAAAAVLGGAAYLAFDIGEPVDPAAQAGRQAESGAAPNLASATSEAKVAFRISCLGGCNRVELDSRIYRQDEFASAASQHGEQHVAGELQIKVAPGRHRIRVEKDGYVPKAEDIDVAPETPFERSYDLKPREGRLPADVIKNIVARSGDKYRACYDVARGREPQLKGKLLATFVIGVRGDVDRVALRGIGDEPFQACVEQSLRSLSFPAPEGGGVIEVNYPLTFEQPTRPRGTKKKTQSKSNKKQSKQSGVPQQSKTNVQLGPGSTKGSYPEPEQQSVPPQKKKKKK